MAAEVQPGLEAFWAQDGRRERVLRRLVAAYLPLSVAELEEWAADSEAFHHAALNVAWEESVHGCAEHLASALFEGQREALAPVAVELLRSVAAVDGSAAGQLAKEAVYRLAAVVAHELQDAVDFSAWLQAPGGLLADAAAPGAAGPQPVRRQALLLPSYWLGALKPPDRAALYERALEALQPSAVNDLAVRLAALVTLQALVEDWGFEEEAFAPCAPRCFEALAALLRKHTGKGKASKLHTYFTPEYTLCSGNKRGIKRQRNVTEFQHFNNIVFFSLVFEVHFIIKVKLLLCVKIGVQVYFIADFTRNAKLYVLVKVKVTYAALFYGDRRVIVTVSDVAEDKFYGTVGTDIYGTASENFAEFFAQVYFRDKAVTFLAGRTCLFLFAPVSLLLLTLLVLLVFFEAEFFATNLVITYLIDNGITVIALVIHHFFGHIRRVVHIHPTRSGIFRRKRIR